MLLFDQYQDIASILELKLSHKFLKYVTLLDGLFTIKTNPI